MVLSDSLFCPVGSASYLSGSAISLDPATLTRDLHEKIVHRENELQLIEQELEESRSERGQKFRELKKREQQMEEFFKTFNDIKVIEMSHLSELEGKIMQTLEVTARYLVNAEQTPSLVSSITAASSATLAVGETGGQPELDVKRMKEQANFKSAEFTKSEATAAGLLVDHARLTKDLAKVDMLEKKISQASYPFSKFAF
ncbi:unnamed protein product [Protopolystoma xenopodis]|uniref:Uncharacterized protein n=1 Tax=Protopolystoma xenopodis TaxID=117903 RepID=A0A3S4ZVN3_9PLAT|nr:unnamed protein product [Protopolystoma xenopodis]